MTRRQQLGIDPVPSPEVGDFDNEMGTGMNLLPNGMTSE